jgi:hypothetical protein
VRSLIILEVEHDETTDELQELADYVFLLDSENFQVVDYTVRVDVAGSVDECPTLGCSRTVLPRFERH